jgi:DNA excision repair protein ERCC-3
MVDVPQNPLIVQSDRTLLLTVDSALYAGARDALARFAELQKSPEHIHTYRLTPLSLWNAAAAGHSADEIVDALTRFSRYDVPQNIVAEVRDYVSRYGLLKLVRRDDKLVLTSDRSELITEIGHHRSVRPNLLGQLDETSIEVAPVLRGRVKQALIKIGFPVEDLAGYVAGEDLAVSLRATALGGQSFGLRQYQTEAAEIFHAGGSERGGSGVICLPCGAGKTVVGMAAMATLQKRTLILCTNITAVRQWIREMLDKTTLREDEVGEYTGEIKQLRPVTVTTYQILTYRKKKGDAFPHFEIFNAMNWGLIIYDEVHLLPAPVFRMTAEIQARRRLGLTATLVREDGREDDVFSLIGPKKYDVPWKTLERQGWIATASCTELRVDMPQDLRLDYALSPLRTQIRIAAENPAKFDVVRRLVERHRGDRVLIIGQYLSQLHTISDELGAPIITGKTRNAERERLFGAFRTGEVPLLIVSKVGNFAVDLPDANVAIQVSGTFGSRQEEAQRLGRILRPKSAGTTAQFYAIVTRDTKDQDFAANRSLFLTEQGYAYEILDADEV